jgi:transaldolase
MKIFLDTADIHAISSWKTTGLIDGVTTNPTHISKVNGSPKKTVLEICKLLPQGDISVEVTETSAAGVYKQAHALAKLAKNIIVKIPCHRDYYAVIAKLADEGVKINITLVFSLIQGLMMSKLGVQYISPFVGRWDDIDQDGVALLFQLRQMIDEYAYSTEVLAASLRHVPHIHQAIMAGADAITVPPDVLAKATDHLLTDKGMELFAHDWKKLGVKQFP